MEVRICFTADTHGLLRDPAMADNLRAIRAMSNADVLLDGGDCLRQANVAWWPGPELRAMRELGYDAVVVGNREFHEFSRLMRRKIPADGPPLLACNLGTRRLLPASWPVQPSLLLKCGELKVGVIGMMPDMSRPQRLAEKLLNRALRWWLLPARFRSYEESVSSEIAGLRPAVDTLVLVAHAPTAVCASLAKRLGGIDLILAGDAHRRLRLPSRPRTEGAPVVSWFWNGRDAGKRGANVAVATVTLRVRVDGVQICPPVELRDIRTTSAVDESAPVSTSQF